MKRLVAKIITFLFKIFGVKVKLENEHYFKSDQPYVVIMNHQSSLDFMSKYKLLYDHIFYDLSLNLFFFVVVVDFV